MPRPEKVEAVATIKERIERAQAVFLAEYAGLSVAAQQRLRRGLREKGAEFKVVKMTLARRAVADLDLSELDDLLVGPTGVTFADDDPVATAKVLKDFSAANDVFVIKGGLLGRDRLTPERIRELAEIEPREVLLSKLAGAFKAPMAQLAGVLSALPRNAASMLAQLLEKKESGELPAPGGAEEAPAAEAQSPESGDSPDSADSPESPETPDSPETPESPESPDSAETPDDGDESDESGEEGTDAAEEAPEEPPAADEPADDAPAGDAPAEDAPAEEPATEPEEAGDDDAAEEAPAEEPAAEAPAEDTDDDDQAETAEEE